MIIIPLIYCLNINENFYSHLLEYNFGFNILRCGGDQITY